MDNIKQPIDVLQYRDAISREPIRISYRGENGHELYMLVMPPEDKAAALSPVIIWIYGGGWNSDNSWRYTPHLRYSAERGAVGVVIAYRYDDGNNGIEIKDCIRDCIDGVKYLCQNADKLGIDLDKVVFIGDSAGGHLAAWLALVDQTVNASILINCCGVMNLTGAKWLERFERYPDPIAAARALSPIYQLNSCSCKVLNLNGDLDNIVSSKETFEFHQACLAEGIESEFHSWQDFLHAFILLDYSMENAKVSEAFRVIDNFLVKHHILPPIEQSAGISSTNWR